MNFRYFTFLLLACFALLKPAAAQVSPDINSGNPSFPFPQFLDYGPDRKTLASKNAPGVTHAEMEQRIKDAYQMMCNNLQMTSDVADGVTYARPAPPSTCNCVEADGYYLLAAAYMGDRTNFNRIYMWTHDRSFHGVQRFIDGQFNSPGYEYSKGLSGAGKMSSPIGTLGGSTGGGQNSATDGDVDVALALLIAYKQWGSNSGVTLSKIGNKNLDYREEALNYIKAMVDTVSFKASSRTDDFVMGDIGLDGYVKGGDTWKELTTKASGGFMGMVPAQGFEGRAAQHIDYVAPAWFRQFRYFLEKENESPWCILQYKRGEASSDWLIGEMYSKSDKTIPVAGWVNDTLGGFQFTNFLDGEDFRTGWRTVMNYVWHGDPEYTWDPDNISVTEGKPNSYEKLMGQRFAAYLKNRQGGAWNHACRSAGTIALTFKGPSTVPYYTTPEGDPLTTFPLNLIIGAGTPSAIAAQDFDLMGQLFRQCVIEWDNADLPANQQHYLTSRPTYFHEWFKLLGMLTLSGNYTAPEHMVPKPNLKVYHKIDKTYGFTGDVFKYTISYRNYGTVDASGTVLKFGVPPGFTVTNAGGGTLSGDSITWQLADGANGLKGFNAANPAQSSDSVIVFLKAGPAASGRYCTNARISCSNGYGWTSNEYPNNKTAVMERNCVDITKRALKITKTANKTEVQYGQNVTYKIKFENLSEAGWLNGGRPGVNIALGHRSFSNPATASQDIYLQARIYNDADEAYIDYGNYRFSYFINETGVNCLNGTPGCNGGWRASSITQEGAGSAGPTFLQENIVPGGDNLGKWNQRMIFRFGNQLATTTQHLLNYRSPLRVHEGAIAPMRSIFRLGIDGQSFDWTDDWSWDAGAASPDEGLYLPVGDDYTDPSGVAKPVTTWHRNACQTAPKVLKNVLVEEFDGYGWRRIYGSGPLPGRDVENVVIKDTFPAGFVVKAFLRDSPLATKRSDPGPNGTTIYTWTIPKLLINQKDSIIYQVQVNGSCPGADQTIINKAWISASTESPVSGEAGILATCKKVAACPEATTITKTSDKTTYAVGDTVRYKISFKQTLGSINEADLTEEADWTAKAGDKNLAVFAGGNISVGQINNGNLVLTSDYSFGKNTLGDGLEGTIQPPADQKVAIVVRHGGTSPDDGVFVVIKSGFSTGIEIYNGATLIGSGALSVSNPASLDFRIQLKEQTLDLWLGLTPATFSATPLLSVTGIKDQTGFAGIARGALFGNATGTAVLTYWKSHLDAAFNVTVTDTIPAGIIKPSSILPLVPVTGNVITWTAASGKTPLLFNAESEYSWNGVLDVCSKVTNIAYVNTLGISGNQFGVCHEINCSASPVCNAPATVVIDGMARFEKGGQTTLSAVATPAAPGFIYNWFKLPDLTTPLSGSGLDKTEITVTDTGKYLVRVVSPTDLTCFTESAVKKVTYICEEPVIKAFLDGFALPEPIEVKLCPGQTGFLSFAPQKYDFVYDIRELFGKTLLDNQYVFAGDSLKIFISSADIGTYELDIFADIGDQQRYCWSPQSNPVIINISNLTATVTTTGLNYCDNQNGVTLTANAVSGATYEWFKGEVSQGIPVQSNRFLNATEGIWKVKITVPGGCSKISDLVTVARIPAPQASIDMNGAPFYYCAPGNGVSLTAIGGDASGTYQWLTGTPAQPATGTASVRDNTLQGTWAVVITASNGCRDTSDFVEVQELPPPLALIQTGSFGLFYCKGGPGVALTAADAGPGYTYQWLLEGVPAGLPSADRTRRDVKQGKWSVLVSAQGRCSMTSAQVTVSEVSAASVAVAGDTNLCQGDTLKLSVTDPTGWWILPDNSVVRSAALVLADALPGLYIVHVPGPADGCSGTDSVTVIVNPLPEAEITPGQFSYCAQQNGTTLLAKDAGTGATYQWFKGNLNTGTGITLPNATEGEYFVVVNRAGCSATSSKVTVKLVSELEVFISAPQTEYCTGGSGVELEAVTSANAQQFEWTKDGNSLTASASNKLSNATAGEYYVTVISGVCQGTSKTPLIIREVTSLVPQLKLHSNTADTCFNAQVEITATGTTGSIEWFHNGLSKGILPSYSFALTDTAGIKAVLKTTLSCARPDSAVADTIIKLRKALLPSVTIEKEPGTGSNCEGEEAVFHVADLENEGTKPSYRWIVNNTPLANETTKDFRISDWNNATSVELEVTNNDACSVVPQNMAKSNLITLTGNPATEANLQILSINNNLVNGFICTGATVELDAQTNMQDPSLTFRWTNSDTSATGKTFTHKVINTVEDTVTVHLEGCYTGKTSDTLTVRIQIEEPATVKINNNVNGNYNGQVCQGDSVRFTTTKTGNIKSYAWYKNDTLLTALTGEGATISGLKNSDIVKVVAEQAVSCPVKGIDSTLVNVSPGPKAGFANGPGPVTVCPGSDTLLASIETNPALQYTWYKDTAVFKRDTVAIRVSEPGSYRLIITNGTCRSEAAMQVNLTDFQVKALAEPIEFFAGEPVSLKSFLNSQAGAVTFTWFPQEIMQQPQKQNTLAFPQKSGIVKVIVRTSGNCIASDSVLLLLKERLFIPNAIVPGANDINAVWGIKGAESYPEIDIKVYNRWGSLVYEQKGYTTPWDGTINGKDLPTGTYYYIIRDKAFDKPFIGDLTIVR